MVKSKRSNYLIDKPFQIGFILKYLFIVIFTIILCFTFAALYYFQDSLLGTNRLDSVVIYNKQAHKITPKGEKIYNFESDKIQIYLTKNEKGEPIFKCYKVFPVSVTKYKEGDVIESLLNKDVNQLIKDKIIEPDIGKVEVVTTRFHMIIFPLIYTGLALIVIISIYSLFFSHRMAGPIYRLRISLDRMIAGDFDFKIRARKNDFFLNIVEKLEQLRLKIKNNDFATPSPAIKEKIENIKKMVINRAPYEEILKKLEEIE